MAGWMEGWMEGSMDGWTDVLGHTAAVCNRKLYLSRPLPTSDGHMSPRCKDLQGKIKIFSCHRVPNGAFWDPMGVPPSKRSSRQPPFFLCKTEVCGVLVANWQPWVA